MTQAKGIYSKTLMAFETADGVDPTDVATSAILIPFTKNSLLASQNSTDSTILRGRRDPAEPTPGNVTVDGDIPTAVDSTVTGYLLKGAFGNPTTTENTADSTYTHVYKPGNTQPSLMIEKGFPDIGTYHKYNGCKVSKIDMSVGGDGELLATYSFMGEKETIGTASVGTTPKEPVLDKFTQFDADLELGGNTMAIATALTLSIDMGLDGETQTIGSKGYRTSVNEGLIKISGKLTAFFTSSEYIKLAADNTTTSMKLTLTNGKKVFSIYLPEIRFTRNSPAVDGAAGIKQELNFNAFYKENTEKAAIVLSLTNDTASYAA